MLYKQLILEKYQDVFNLTKNADHIDVKTAKGSTDLNGFLE